MSAISEYNMLLDLGELLELYPGLTGEWKNDSKKFTSMWEKNQEIFNDYEIDEFEEL